MSASGLLSIIVPTYNGAHKITNLLESLETQSVGGFEVIVVIDGSTDNTLEVLQANTFHNFNLKIIEQKNSGRSITRNNGVKAASSELILFLDDDMRVEPTTLQTHLDHHEASYSTILVGNQIENKEFLTTDIQHYKRYLSKKWMNVLSDSYKKINRPFITAAHCSISKQLFMKLGMFDERLTDAEDYDLALKAINNDIDIYFNPTIFGWHDDLITAQSYLNRLKEYAASNMRLRHINPLATNYTQNTHPLKRWFYYPFSFPRWISYIDKEAFFWLPQPLRYKIYDIIFHSQANVYPR